MIIGLLRSLSNGWKTIPPERHVQFGPQPPPARLYVASAVMRDRKEAIQANNHNLGPPASTSTAAASAVMRDERKRLAQYATSSLGRLPLPPSSSANAAPRCGPSSGAPGRPLHRAPRAGALMPIGRSIKQLLVNVGECGPRWRPGQLPPCSHDLSWQQAGTRAGSLGRAPSRHCSTSSGT